MKYDCSSARLALTLLLIVIAAPTLRHTPAQAESPENGKLKIDDSTPEAAIRSFFGALAAGDSRSALQLLASPKEMSEWVEIQAKTSTAFKQLGEAAIAKFGEEGKTLQVPIPAALSLQKLETIKPTSDGKLAEWKVNPNAPLKLKNIDGHWKLDLYESWQSPAHLKLANEVHGRIARYVSQIAADLNNGKFKSIVDVRKEFKRQRELMNKELDKPAPETERP
jgi:hypothetical protein